MVPTVVATGISHILAVVRASHEAGPSTLDYELCGFPFHEKDHWPPFDSIDGEIRINPALETKLTAAIEDDRCNFIVTSLFGNRWPRHALLNPPRLYDVFPSEYDAPCDDREREIIPYDLMASLALDEAQDYLRFAKALRKRTTKAIYEIVEPPPIAFPGPFTTPAGVQEEFVEEVKAVGFSPSALRHKMWRTFQNVTVKICEDIGLGIIDLPENVIGSDGCLLPQLAGGDTIHANLAYGRLVLEQINYIVLNGPYEGRP